MRIALIGYGRMGKAIEKVALERNHEIVATINAESTENDWNSVKSADVAIEFSLPSTVVANIKKCFELNVPVVVGTTGWYNEFSTIQQECKAKNGGLFHATNFSVGVNLFFEVNKRLAQLMSSQPDYQLGIHEEHHIHKLDAPSGTAISIAEQIIDNNSNIAQWNKDQSSSKDSVGITSLREGEIPGTHVVRYENEIDFIEIKHEAKNRKGFSVGAVLAAEFMKDQHGIFTMADLLKV